MAQSLITPLDSQYVPSASVESSCALSVPYSMELMRRPSITPLDEGCQDWLAGKLSALGFDCHQFKMEGVSNLVAILAPAAAFDDRAAAFDDQTTNNQTTGEKPIRTVAFAGHTDVVPPGDVNKWRIDPFSPQIQGNELIGRGAADMKTGVAAMLAATEQVLRAQPQTRHRYLWLITSDEEGEAEFGTKAIMA